MSSMCSLQQTIASASLALAVVTHVVAGHEGFSLPQEIQPNIVLLFADDLGVGDVGYNSHLATLGKISSPVLDDLAAQGTKLTRFYTNNLCTPSRASLLTGRFASRTNMKSPLGLLGFARALNEDEELLPEILKDEGYQTHMVGKWHLGSHERKYSPLARGFDSHCGSLGGSIDYFYHNVAPLGIGKSGDYKPHDLHCSVKADQTSTNDGGHGCAVNPTPCDLVLGHSYYDNETTSDHRYDVDFAQPAVETITPDAATYKDFYITNIYGRKSMEVIKRHDPSDGPLFLYAAFTAGHHPQQALDVDFEECDVTAITDSHRLVLCAMARSLDRNVGYIIDALKDKGMWDDTVFVFASDNGAPLALGGDNGRLKGGKGDLYEGGIQAPAFVHFGENTVKRASNTRGVENSQPIHLVDLFATIVGGCVRHTFKNKIDGRNLWSYLSEGTPIAESTSNINFNIAAGPGFYSSATGSPFNADGSHVEAVIATYNGKDFKLCRNCDGVTGDEIFDLTEDPYETTNLLNMPEYAKVVTYLVGLLAEWVDVSFPDLEYPTLVERAADLLEDAGLNPDLAHELVNGRRCSLPMDSPEFICSDCSRLEQDFPLTSPPAK